MQIKVQLGKLKLSLALEELLNNQKETNDLAVLPITFLYIHQTGAFDC